LTSTTLGPSPGAPDDTTAAQILTGGQGGGLDAGVIAGSLSALHGDAIALGRHRADAAHARVGDRMAIMLDADNELNHWLGPFFVAMMFAFTSIAVVNTLILIALRRRRELALLRLTGATTRQVRSMARWEAILIIAIGLGIGLAITATALLPLSHALTGGFRPYAPAGWLAAILGVSALLALVALSVPTRRALRTQPVEAIGIRE
jgi:predicted lysophospholipase L1 biosynthesis ABC-type transport system permease subunit